jgi:hypothetical protein
MTKAAPILTNFTAGEFSPRLRGRVDLEKYYNGCETLENFIIMPHGGATKRPGTHFIAAARKWEISGDDYSFPIRLIPFIFSTEQAYVLEFSNYRMRVFMDHGQVLDDSGAIYEIETPYNYTDLFELKYVQSADVMYIVHPDYRPRKLMRTDHNAWTLETVTFEVGGTTYGNVADDDMANDDTADWTESNITLIFDTDHYFFTTMSASPGQISLDNIELKKGYVYHIGCKVKGANVTGRFFLQDSSGTYWGTPFTPPNTTYQNFGKNLRCRSDTTTGKVGIRFTSSTPDYVFAEMKDFSCGQFTEQFDYTDHYPAAIAIFEERLVLAGTNERPHTVWMSRTASYEDFTQGPDDDDSIEYTIGSDGVNAVLWLVPENKLLMGTTGNEWIIGATMGGDPITPTDVLCKRQSTHGSANIQALLINECVLFVQRSTRKVLEMAYNFEKDAYVSPDMTLLAEHIAHAGITEVSYQQDPDSILWAVTNDGELLGMTYLREQDVVGWHRHITGSGDDLVESIATIPGENETEVYVSVRRKTGTYTSERYIEYFASRDLPDSGVFLDSALTWEGESNVLTSYTNATPIVVTAVGHDFTADMVVRFEDVVGDGEGDSLNQQCFIVKNPAEDTFELYTLEESPADGSAVEAYTSGGHVYQVAKTFSGLDHLELRTVSVLGDGYYRDDYEVSNNEITIDEYAHIVVIGLPYTATLQTIDLESGAQQGTAQGRMKRIHKAIIRFYETIHGTVGYYDENEVLLEEEIAFSYTGDEMDSLPELYTGDKVVAFPSGYDRQAKVCITHDKPYPCTVLAIMPRMETYEG